MFAVVKQEPRSPGRHQLETESPLKQAPRMPKGRAGVSEKIEEPDRTEPNRESSMVDDPEILTFVKEKLRTLPILALSELTKACQVSSHSSSLILHLLALPSFFGYQFNVKKCVGTSTRLRSGEDNAQLGAL